MVMKGSTHKDYPEDLNSRMDACGVSQRLKGYILRCVDLHSYPAPGVLIGAFMVDYALELLGASADEKLYAVCETPKCAPDALQAIAHCTTGNNRLRIIPIGKFAITMNIASDGSITRAVRIFVDLEKLRKFPVINSWYANSPAFNKSTMKDTLQDEIFRAGRQILSYEWVSVGVKPKRKWKSVTCNVCGETVPDYLIEGDRCAACGSMKYYEKIS
jgi:formylmethanofuran dehydrogenase subunit E